MTDWTERDDDLAFSFATKVLFVFCLGLVGANTITTLMDIQVQYTIYEICGVPFPQEPIKTAICIILCAMQIWGVYLIGVVPKKCLGWVLTALGCLTFPVFCYIHY